MLTNTDVNIWLLSTSKTHVSSCKLLFLVSRALCCRVLQVLLIEHLYFYFTFWTLTCNRIFLDHIFSVSENSFLHWIYSMRHLLMLYNLPVMHLTFGDFSVQYIISFSFFLVLLFLLGISVLSVNVVWDWIPGRKVSVWWCLKFDQK